MLGVIGRGRMGTALARAAASTGLDVLVSDARPDAPVRPAGAGCGEPVGVDDLIEHAAMVALALPFPVGLRFAAVRLAGVGRSRTLVDLTNPGLCPDAVVPPGRSGGELIAEAATDWLVAKAFNTVPAGQFDVCRLNGAPVSVPIASDHPAATAQVAALARRLGFEPLDAGGIVSGRDVESLAVLLVRISHRQGFAGRIGVHIGQPEPARLSNAVSA